MDPVLVALFLTLALVFFVVAVLIAGPERFRVSLTWVALGLTCWLIPAWWAAVKAA